MTTVVEVDPGTRMAAAAVGEGAATDSSAEALPISPDILDGGEVVLLAIKPSPWFVVFDSARWLLLGLALLVISAIPSLHVAGMSSKACAQLAGVIMAARLGIAFLRWSSRFYVLTNRRVMRLRGVFKPDILACPLVKIQNTRVATGWHERLTGLGTILLFAEDLGESDLNWYEIARCDEVHARVRRAIERAIDSQPHC